MSHHDDAFFDERMRRALKEGTKSLEFTEAMQEAVLNNVQRTIEAKRKKRSRRLSKRVRVAFTAGVTGAVACVMLFLVIFHIANSGAPAVGQHVIGVSSASQGATLNAPFANTQLTASLAPIESTAVSLVRLTNPAAQPTPFAVHMTLYNNSNQAVRGQDLQGMLFILKAPVGLNPVLQADWEYFINGPSAVIPAHHSIPLSFTPNPVPPFSTLSNRYAHVIWLYRNPKPNQPTLDLGTLPIHVSQVQVRVLSTAADGMQYLQISAVLHNRSAASWSMRSALGMLFFQRTPGDLLLSLGTYKYFDDITPARGQSATIGPGKDGKAVFFIGGVPGVDLTKLPLSILLVSRSQVGA